MILGEITLHNFRSYGEYRLELDPHVTTIVGRNGIGKTNLLEAIYVLMVGGSFRASDGDLKKYDATWWRLQGTVDESPREVRYELEKRPPKSLIEHDTHKRFTYKNRLPVVLFEPQDLLFVSGSPSRRRDTLDGMLASLSGAYKRTLSRYERALLQRNNLLRTQSHQPNLKDLLFVWDVMFAESASYLLTERQAFIAQINELLPNIYQSIAGRDDRVEMKYSSPVSLTPSQLLSQLDTKLSLDMVRGTTSIGPHRDDVSFYLNETDAKVSASRGETRSLILSFKLAYAALLEQTFTTAPLILLDDVFSELDDERQQNLLSHLADRQVVITDTRERKDTRFKEIRL